MPIHAHTPKSSKQGSSLWNAHLLRKAIIDSLKKLSPIHMIKNPVMFVVEMGSAISTFLLVTRLIHHSISGEDIAFLGQTTFWLWTTVIFSNFAEALAEGRGKAQAESLKKTRSDTKALLLLDRGATEWISSNELKKGMVVIVEVGQLIPSDGTVIEGIATVDESAITGESAPVIREAGGDRSAVTGGTMVLSDRIVVQISSNKGESFLDQMISLVEGAARQKTPNEIALDILLAGLSIIFLLVVVSLKPFAIYAQSPVSTIVLVALLVCLIPTTIGALISSIGIAGMDRLVQRNVLCMSGRAVEAAGDIDVLILDKTGTITMGNRMATDLTPDQGISFKDFATAAFYSSQSDLTPEGRSISQLTQSFINPQEHSLTPNLEGSHSIPFTAETKMSGLDFQGISYRKGAVSAIKIYVNEQGHHLSEYLLEQVEIVSKSGGTPLIVTQQGVPQGLIHLKDVVKPGIKERLQQIREMGIRSIMVTGDHELTAKSIAHEAGVDDFVAEAKPEDKLFLIRRFQAEGKMVAMSGDGTNDAPALAQSDVGLVMNTGTQAAREAGNMIDLDSDPTKLIEIVQIGKQLLITRGALTTFSISNDISKYFAIIPAIFSASLPVLNRLNIMNLSGPKNAILATVIFNAIIIIFLIPLSLRGVKFKPQSAVALLRKNLFIYGLGGLFIPFIGIKIIDWLLSIFD